MAKVVTRTGKGAAITQSENDSNLDSFCGINESQTGTTYTVDESDQNNIIELSNASTVTVTLTLISTLISAIDTSDFAVTLKNIGAGSVVVTPTTDTFDDGDAAKTLAQYEWLTIQTNNGQDRWNVIASSDASKVDGLDASQFLRSDADDETIGNITINKAIPQIKYLESDAALDQKKWRNIYDGGGAFWQIIDDAEANSETYINVQRSGTGAGIAVDSVTWTATDINLVGQFQLGGTDVTADAADLNRTDITTEGTVVASEVVTADSSGDVNFPSGTQPTLQGLGLLDLVYPVGAIFQSRANTEPSSFLGGTWTTIRTGRVLISENATYAIGVTGGSQNAIVVGHNHPSGTLVTASDGRQAFVTSMDTNGSGGTLAGNVVQGQNDDFVQNPSAYNHTHAISGNTGSTGSSGTGANMQEYEPVYMWERAA